MTNTDATPQEIPAAPAPTATAPTAAAPAPPVDTSGLEPVLVEPETLRSASGLPVVEVTPTQREQAVLVLGTREWVVTKPKTLYAIELMDQLEAITKSLTIADTAQRGKALQDLRQFLTCVFDREAHPAQDRDMRTDCGACDACAVLAQLRDPGAGPDVYDMVDGFNRLMHAWGLEGNRAQRRAANRG